MTTPISATALLGSSQFDRNLAETLAGVIDAGIHAWWLGNPTVLEPGRLEWDFAEIAGFGDDEDELLERFGARVTDRILGWTAMTECGLRLEFPRTDLLPAEWVVDGVLTVRDAEGTLVGRWRFTHEDPPAVPAARLAKLHSALP